MIFAAALMASCGNPGQSNGANKSDEESVTDAGSTAMGFDNDSEVDFADDQNAYSDAEWIEEGAEGIAAGVVKELSESEFKDLVCDFTRMADEPVFIVKRPTVVDFYATWCGPCKALSPIMDELAADYAGRVDFFRVDVDKAQDLSQAFQIASIPTLFFIAADGSAQAALGYMERTELEQFITQILQ